MKNRKRGAPLKISAASNKKKTTGGECRQGDDSIFADPKPADNEEAPSTNEPNLLDKYDGFMLMPQKLIDEYKGKAGDTTAHAKLFRHMTNFVCHEHVIASKKASAPIQLEPSAGLDVNISNHCRRRC